MQARDLSAAGRDATSVLKPFADAARRTPAVTQGAGNSDSARVWVRVGATGRTARPRGSAGPTTTAGWCMYSSRPFGSQARRGGFEAAHEEEAPKLKKKMKLRSRRVRTTTPAQRAPRDAFSASPRWIERKCLGHPGFRRFRHPALGPRWGRVGAAMTPRTRLPPPANSPS
jgi:hypothetical protein